MKTNLIFIQILMYLTCVYECKRVLFCFYTNWAQYRSNEGKFLPEDIDPSLCTHINYAFADLRNSILSPFEWNDEDTDWSIGMYRRVTQLKNQNPELKVMLSVGGWNKGSEAFSTMVHDDNLRNTFVNTTVGYLKKHNFDGLDWEFPGMGAGSKHDDKIYFTKLLQELRVAFDPNKLLLTIAVSADRSLSDTAYEAEEIHKLPSRYCDYLLVMAYDFYGPWNNIIGFNAPLYPQNKEIDYQRKMNADASVQYWLEKGTPRDKLVLGLATYGHTFRLLDPKQSKPGDLASGPGTDGIYTRQAGILSYYEVCPLLSKGWKRVFDTEQLVPYITNYIEWASYDDQQSFKEKTNYIKANDLAGAMVWSLDFDDFNGKFCGSGKYPLISLVKNELNEASSPSSATTQSSTTSFEELSTSRTVTIAPTLASTTSTTTTSPSPRTTISSTSIKAICKNGNGRYSDSTSECKSYFVCEHIGTESARIHKMNCPPGTKYDTTLVECNHAYAVTCQN